MLVEYWQKFCGHFLSENTVCPLLMLANFETFESWIQPDTILQRFFPIQFLQVQDKAKLFLIMQPLWASCVSMSHYTVTVFLYRIFFLLNFCLCLCASCVWVPYCMKNQSFFSQIIACACAFLKWKTSQELRMLSMSLSVY